MATAEELKALGNKAFVAKDFETAIKHFTDAIAVDPSNHVLFSNRSACYSSLKEYEKAYQDGLKTIELKPDFWKGYTRKAIPLYMQGRYEEAKEAYAEGLKVDASNATLLKGISDCEQAIRSERAQNPLAAMTNLFSPDIKDKIAADPTLAPYLQDADFVKKLDDLIADPKTGFEKHGKDERIMAVFLAQMKAKMAGMGMNMDFGTPPASSPASSTPAAESPSSTPVIEEKEAPKKEEAKSEPTPMDTSEPGESSNSAEREEAEKEKEAGNAAYSAKDFDTAIAHYSKAVELDSTNIVYRLNRAAVYFARKEFEKVVAECDEAVEVGRSVRCDFKQIGKALHRKGRAQLKLKQYPEAVETLQKSMAEHRNAPVLNDLQLAEKLKKKADAEAYFNPELAVEAKNRGNEFFKKNQYPEAVKEYSDAIKRNPKDAALYSNRAAAYSKLMAYSDALKDCDTCIATDPKFIKGYTRKAAVYNAMKDYRKAMTMWEKALEVDPNNQEVLSGYSQTMMKIQSTRGDKDRAERALQDPEIQEILREDQVQGVLNLMKSDPAAAQRAIQRSPDLSRKFNILMSAGLV